MTTTVAIAAQYDSGNPTSRPSSIEIVAATVVRKACDSDGRFSLFQLQSFMEEIIFACGSHWQDHNRCRALSARHICELADAAF